MRQFVLLGLIITLALAATIRPKWGAYSLVWFSLMRPDVLAWGQYAQYPFALILELGTFIGCYKCLKAGGAVLRNPIFRLLLILQVPIALSVVFAMHPTLCYEAYRTYIGCVISAVVIPLLIQTEDDFRTLLIIAALSIGYVGARFGLFGTIHGGVRFGAGYGGSYSDNNDLGLALAMAVPLGWYVRGLVRSKLMRLGILISVFLTIAAVIFTFSRGAAISLTAVFLMVIIHSRHRLFLVAALAVLIWPSLYLVKDSYFDRMETLNGSGKKKKEGSIQDRMETSRVAGLMWMDYPFIGVGFGTQNQRLLWFNYADTSITGKYPLVIHDTYLQMLVDSGTFALLAYIALIGGSIIMLDRSSRRLRRLNSPLYGAPLALEGGLIAFAVGSTFLTRITFDFTYILLMMGASWLIVEPRHLEALRREEEAGEEAEEEAEGAAFAEAGT